MPLSLLSSKKIEGNERKMTEIKSKIYHDDEFDIDINEYLTYAQIQQIVNAVIKASKENDSWSERQTNIDMLVLFHATNIGVEKLEEIGHEALLTSGLINRVNCRVMNLQKVYEAIDFTESWKRALYKLTTQLPEMAKSDAFKAALNKYGKSSKE